MRLFIQTKAAKKIFLSNHLIFSAGDSLAFDILRREKLLAMADKIFFFEFDHLQSWIDAGAPAEKLAARPYCVDTEYYSPGAGAGGKKYIFSAGSAGRNYAPVFEALSRIPLEMMIFTNSDIPLPENIKKRVVLLSLNKNLDKIKMRIAGSALTLVPVKDGYLNPTAGMAVSFMCMASGGIILARGTEWMKKYIRDGENGFLYESLTGKNLLESIGRILSLSAAARAKIGASARRTMLAKASLDKFAAGFIAGLEK